jgi:oligosaccharide repeat unit polymerase
MFQSTKLTVSVSILLCLAHVALFLSFEEKASMTPHDLYLMSVASIIIQAWTLVTTAKLQKSIFNPIMLFLISNFVFGAGLAFLEVFSLSERGFLYGNFSTETCIKSLLMVSVGTTGLHVGVLLGLVSWDRYFRRDVVDAVDDDLLDSGARVGWFLMAVSAIPSIVILTNSMQLVLQGRSFDLYQQEVSTGLGAAPDILANFLVPSSILVLASSRRRLIPVLVSFLVVFTHTTVMLLLGVRSTATMSLLAYAWVYERVVQKIPRPLVLLGGGFLIGVVFPVLAIVRMEYGADKYSPSHLMEVFFGMESPFVAALSEMGGTLGDVAYTIELVPSVRDYDYGVSYFYAVLTLIPNVFGDLHPSKAHGTLSDWLIWTVDPTTAAAGGGIGFTYIAEAFVNFGWAGPPLVLVAIGFGLALFFQWANSSGNPLKIAMFACYLNFVLRLPRDETQSVLRPLLWYAFLPYLASVVLARAKPQRAMGDTP